MVSAEVARRVVALLNQHDKVSCCLSSKQMYDALMHPDAWGRVTVYRLDARATQFLHRMRPAQVTIQVQGVSSKDVEAFLADVSVTDARQALVSLHLEASSSELCPRNALMGYISEFTRLSHLEIVWGGVGSRGCLVFKDPLPNLRSLRIEERTLDARALEVYFGDAVMRRLSHVELVVATSDILAVARRMPLLAEVVYVNESDSFEDADLADMRLELLDVDVHTTTCQDYLFDALSRSRRISKLRLTAHCPLKVTKFLNVNHLNITMCCEANEASIDTWAVKYAASVSVVSDPCDGPADWTLRFAGSGSWKAFSRWAQDTELRIGCGGTVVVAP
jgi:hypothetical protein